MAAASLALAPVSVDWPIRGRQAISNVTRSATLPVIHASSMGVAEQPSQIQGAVTHEDGHEYHIAAKHHERQAYASGHQHGSEPRGAQLALGCVIQRMHYDKPFSLGLTRSCSKAIQHRRSFPFQRSHNRITNLFHPAGNSPGATICAAKMSDSAKSSAMIVQFTALFHGVLQNFAPNKALSFRSNCRKMMAEGSMIPASTWTLTIISCSGARGMRTMAAAIVIERA